jgi:ABC-type Fe3+ transport system permease subunit
MDPPFLCFLAVVFLILFFFWTCFFYFFLQQATTQETEGGAHRGTGARPTAGSRGVLCPSGPIRVCFFFFAFFTFPFFLDSLPFFTELQGTKGRGTAARKPPRALPGGIASRKKGAGKKEGAWWKAAAGKRKAALR